MHSSSKQLIDELARAGDPVLLAFSRGKDSIAAWLALAEAGVKVVPYHLDLIPGLAFVNTSISYFEKWFGQKIMQLPHPSFQRWLTNYVFVPPERCGVIDAANLWAYTYDELVAEVRRDIGADLWVCDGVRTADSPSRRIAISKYGPLRENTRKISVIWDWRIADVRAAIGNAGIRLPVDYEWWGRSFDGLDHRFLAPLRHHAPGDFARVLDWFPLADLELYRCKEKCCDDYRG